VGAQGKGVVKALGRVIMNGNDVHIKLLGNMQGMHVIDLRIHNTCLIADILNCLLFFAS
jgi:hypothetical protein